MTQITSTRRASPWVIGVIAFMCIVIAVNALMITLAISSSRGEIESRPYERGMHYEQTLSQHRIFAGFDWDMDSELSNNSAGGSELRFAISHNNAPVVSQKLRADIIRPSEIKFDRSCQLVESSPGVYGCKLDLLPKGPYLIRLWSGDNARSDHNLILE